mgnify:FL=1
MYGKSKLWTDIIKVQWVLSMFLFEQPSHVESVALLVRNISTKEHVVIEVRPEELGS